MPGMNRMGARDPGALLAYIPASARRILDCGSGDDARARLRKERGTAELTGFEPEAALVETEAVDRRLPANALDTELPFADEYFDCIVCDDLLAQWRDPKPVLPRLARVLSREGVFVATFPNLRYYKAVAMLAEGRWTYEEEGILSRSHLRFFTAPEVTRLLNSSGFETRGFAALRGAAPEELPLDAQGHLRVGRVTIGPLDGAEYKSFLTEEYVVLATRATV